VTASWQPRTTMTMTCELCTDPETAFRAPYDQVGTALVCQHLLSEHGVELPAWPRYDDLAPTDRP
jgi:hypothetical protein